MSSCDQIFMNFLNGISFVLGSSLSYYAYSSIYGMVKNHNELFHEQYKKDELQISVESWMNENSIFTEQEIELANIDKSWSLEHAFITLIKQRLNKDD